MHNLDPAILSQLPVCIGDRLEVNARVEPEAAHRWKAGTLLQRAFNERGACQLASFVAALPVAVVAFGRRRRMLHRHGCGYRCLLLLYHGRGRGRRRRFVLSAADEHKAECAGTNDAPDGQDGVLAVQGNSTFRARILLVARDREDHVRFKDLSFAEVEDCRFVRTALFCG